MNRLFSVFYLLFICLLFMGCPYESKVPIDKPSVKINPKLLGNWIDTKSENDMYSIKSIDPYTYHIEKKQKDNDESETQFAYTSMIGQTPFLNLWKSASNDTASHSYFLYKINWKSDDEFTLAEITENIDETFSSSAALKKFIANNMKNSYFYSKEELHLIRSKE